jgi:hypothetical protein
MRGVFDSKPPFEVGSRICIVGGVAHKDGVGFLYGLGSMRFTMPTRNISSRG